MKIIFLDIDGVLNSFKYDLSRTEDDGNIDLTRLPLLKRIVDCTDARIVLTSSWRRLWKKDGCFDIIGLWIESLFESAGLDIYDKTPEIDPSERGSEVLAWLETNKSEVDSFVIIDDMLGGWGILSDRLVRTDARIGFGLMEQHVLKAIEILERPIEL
jgi:hypothetical protein